MIYGVLYRFILNDNGIDMVEGGGGFVCYI